MDLTTKVVRRWLSANVVPFRPNSKSSLPKIEIGGKKYVLSDDAGPIASETFGAEEEGSSGHARLIRGPAHGSKFKYLWVYDTDHKYVVMWRTTDGNEKLAGPANSVMHYVLRLDQKGHLNRVPNEEYRKIESAMRKLEDETYEALKKTNKENETDFQKEVNARTQEFFDHHVRPKIERAIHDVQQGAVPLGFKPFGPKGEPSLRLRVLGGKNRDVARNDITLG